MDGTASAEIAQVDNTEKTQVDKTEANAKTEQPKTNRFTSFIRRVLGKSQDTKQNIEPVVPEVPLEELKQDLANLEDIRKRGGSDFNDPQSRAQDDIRMEQLRTAIASRTPQSQAETQPTIVPEVPQEQPAEEPKVA